jgi:hypothetical protein
MRQKPPWNPGPRLAIHMIGSGVTAAAAEVEDIANNERLP